MLLRTTLKVLHSHIISHPLLKLSYLLKQLRDDLLLLILLRTLLKPSKVLMLHVILMSLLIERIERPRVAPLEDELLSCLDIPQKNFLALRKFLDSHKLFILLYSCLLLLLDLFFLLLLASFFNASLPTLELLNKSISLLLTLSFKRTAKVTETLLELISDLLDGVFRTFSRLLSSSLQVVHPFSSIQSSKGLLLCLSQIRNFLVLQVKFLLKTKFCFFHLLQPLLVSFF